MTMANTSFIQDAINEAFFGAIFSYNRAQAWVFTIWEEIGVIQYKGAKLAGMEGWIDVGGVGEIKGVCQEMRMSIEDGVGTIEVRHKFSDMFVIFFVCSYGVGSLWRASHDRQPEMKGRVSDVYWLQKPERS